jgi:hypothetical protein
MLLAVVVVNDSLFSARLENKSKKWTEDFRVRMTRQGQLAALGPEAPSAHQRFPPEFRKGQGKTRTILLPPTTTRLPMRLQTRYVAAVTRTRDKHALVLICGLHVVRV